MGQQDRDVEVVARAYEAFEQRDLAGMVALSHPDCEFLPATATLAGRDAGYRGHAGVEQYFADVAQVWRQLRIMPQEYVPTERGVLVLGRVWTQDQRGVVRDFPAAWLWQIEDGLVRSWEVYSGPPADAAIGTRRRRRWRRPWERE